MTVYVNVPDRSSLDFGTSPFEVYVEFTITTGMAPGNRTLVMKGETVLGTGWFIGYGEWDDGNGLQYGLIAQISNESAGGINLDLRAVAAQIYDGQWHSAAVVREAADAVLYLDCVEVDRIPPDRPTDSRPISLPREAPVRTSAGAHGCAGNHASASTSHTAPPSDLDETDSY